MRRFGVIVLLVALAAADACGQQANSPVPPAKASAQPEHVTVYSGGRETKPPKLLPLNPGPISRKKCAHRQDGTVELSLLVDTAGRARNIMFLRPLGSSLDRFAIEIAQADRFKPGTYKDKPAVFARTLEIKMETCFAESEEPGGKFLNVWTLRSAPHQKLRKLRNAPQVAVLAPDLPSRPKPGSAIRRPDYFAGNETTPVVIYTVEARYTPAAMEKGIKGTCVVSLVVDAHGLPENVRVLRSLNPGLDRNAVIAVEQYRFFPAIKNDEPVPAAITIEVNFAPPERSLSDDDQDFDASQE